MWPFTRRHDPNEAPAVKEAQRVRDELFEDLEGAIIEVDRVQERTIEEYERAERERKRGKSHA